MLGPFNRPPLDEYYCNKILICLKLFNCWTGSMTLSAVQRIKSVGRDLVQQLKSVGIILVAGYSSNDQKKNDRPVKRSLAYDCQGPGPFYYIGVGNVVFG